MCTRYFIENDTPEFGYPVFVILTKEPTNTLRKIHDCMPLMLPSEKIDEWISPSANPDSLIQYALNELIMEKAAQSESRQMTFSF